MRNINATNEQNIIKQDEQQQDGDNIARGTDSHTYIIYIISRVHWKGHAAI